MAENGKPHIIILNNEIMPYRIPLFRELYQRNQVHSIVIYSTGRSDERDWNLEPFELDFPHKILTGFSFKLSKPNYDEYRTIWFNPSLFWHLVKLRPDVIIAYEYSLPSLIAFIYSRLTGCGYVTWSEMTPHASRDLSRGQKTMRQLILPHTDAAIGTSLAACEYFESMQLPSDRVFLAPQTFDVTYFHEKTQELRRNDHPPTLLYVGYLNERKGVNYLLEAFKIVHDKYPEARLLIAGRGALRDELEAYVESNRLSDVIQFLGFIEPVNLPPLYVESDVFILPSLEDTFGVVAAEALASGLGLVCSKYAGISSHLVDGRMAYIVDPRDIGAVSDRILSLLRNPDLRDDFVKRSKSFLRQCTPQYNAAIFEEAIQMAMIKERHHE